MDDQNMINVGTAERPALIPKYSLKPDSDEGKEWWNMLVNGSVNLEIDQLDNLLKLLDEEKAKNGIK